MLKDVLESGEFVVPDGCEAQAKALAEAEVSAGKLLEDMTREEILEILSHSDNYMTVMRKLQVGVDYLVYLSQHGLPYKKTFNHIQALDVDISEEMRELYYPNFESLLLPLSKCPPGSPIPPIMALIWLGLSLTDIINLMEDDIQFQSNKMTITYGSKVIECDDTLIINLIFTYIRCDSQLINSRSFAPTFYPLITDGHFLKKVEYLTTGGEYIPYSVTYLSRKIKDNGLKASYVSMSGYFWRVYQQGEECEECEGMPYTNRLTYYAWKRAFYS